MTTNRENIKTIMEEKQRLGREEIIEDRKEAQSLHIYRSGKTDEDIWT